MIMERRAEEPEGTPLSGLVKTLRSKNAGVDMVTFDVFFNTLEDYRRAMDSEMLTVEAIAELYRIDESTIVTYMPLETLLALKFTLRRPRPSGSPGDADIFGAQQYAPLLDVVIP